MQPGAGLMLGPVLYSFLWSLDFSRSGCQMRPTLRIIALCIAAISLAGWAALGANRGWTKTTVDHKHVDTVTGIEYPIRENRFVPGIDLLALSWISAAAMFGGSLIRFQPKQQTTTS